MFFQSYLFLNLTNHEIFPKEMLEWPPRSYVNRIFNIKRWRRVPNGGHFAALEEPDILVSDILSFFNKDLKNI